MTLEGPSDDARNADESSRSSSPAADTGRAHEPRLGFLAVRLWGLANACALGAIAMLVSGLGWIPVFGVLFWVLIGLAAVSAIAAAGLGVAVVVVHYRAAHRSRREAALGLLACAMCVLEAALVWYGVDWVWLVAVPAVAIQAVLGDIEDEHTQPVAPGRPSSPAPQ